MPALVAAVSAQRTAAAGEDAARVAAAAGRAREQAEGALRTLCALAVRLLW